MSSFISASFFAPNMFVKSLLILFISSFLGITSGSFLGYHFPSLCFSAIPFFIILSYVFSILCSFFRRISLVDQSFVNHRFFPLIICFICSLFLSSSVTALPILNDSGFDRIAGLIPFSDAKGYFRQVLTFSSDSFDVWNSRRPFNSALNILQYDLSFQNLQSFLFIRVTFASLGITYFVITIKRYLGLFLSIVISLILVLWIWQFSSSLLSEINCFTVSLVSFSLFITSLSSKTLSKSLIHGSLSLLLFSYGYSLRPYSPLIVVIAAIFLTLSSRVVCQSNLRFPIRLLSIFLSIFFTYASVALPSSLYSHPNSISNSNAAYTILGLTRGTNWQEAGTFMTENYPELSGKQKYYKMRDLSFNYFKQNPSAFIKSTSFSFLVCLYSYPAKIGEAFGISDQLLGLEKKPGFRPGTSKTVLASLKAHFKNISNSFESFFILLIVFLRFLFFLLLLSLTYFLPSSYSPIKYLIFFSLLILFSFAPIVFSDAGWRIAAPLYPGLSLLVTALPLSLRNQHNYTFLLPPPNFIPLLSVVPTFILIFFSISIFYPISSASLRTTPQPFVVSIQHTNSPRWTSANSAVTSSDSLVRWANLSNQPSWSYLFSKYRNNISSISFIGHPTNYNLKFKTCNR